MSKNKRYVAVIIASLAVTVGIGTLSAEPQGEKKEEKKKVRTLKDRAEQQPTPVKVDPARAKAGKEAFADVYKVLLHPRCMNCHPAGEAPLQTDDSRPHRLNITRASAEAGLECAACHQTKNSEHYGVKGGPPGAPHWGLPDKATPLIFQGRTPTQLCKQLKDPDQNGNKSLDQLLEHVSDDALVLWGWNPGGDRTTPPLTHEKFVERFKVWIESGGACP